MTKPISCILGLWLTTFVLAAKAQLNVEELNAISQLERGNRDVVAVDLKESSACTVVANLTWPKWRVDEQGYSSIVSRVAFDFRTVSSVNFMNAQSNQSESAYVAIAFSSPKRFITSRTKSDGKFVDEVSFEDGFEVPVMNGPTTLALAMIERLSEMRDACLSKNGNEPLGPVAMTPLEEYRLGYAYLEPRYGVANIDLAIRLFERAAKGDNLSAQLALGNIYRSGRYGIEQDMVKARNLFEAAARQGSRNAIDILGEMHEKGLGGLDIDLVKAAQLYRLAAEQGLVTAQEALADILRVGRGVPKDWGEARSWYEKALEGGSESAREALQLMQDGVEDTNLEKPEHRHEVKSRSE